MTPPVRIRALAALAALILIHPASAQQGGPRKEDVKSFVVDPAPSPGPTFRYRLLPLESERTPGDAAPIYLRIGLELDPGRFKSIGEKGAAWMGKPAEEFPVAEARTFVDEWRFKTEQIAFGARRQSCDWSYTLPEERERSFEILLPDAQAMRTWARLLEIKARVETLEGRFDEAIRTAETGFAFARHVGEGPFLINGLVGIAMATVTLVRVEEMVTRPGAPNLYWALTALPRPLIGLRGAMETEQRLGENLVPELADLDRPRTEAEWSSLYLRLLGRLDGLMKKYHTDALSGAAPPLGPLDPAGFKARHLAEARRALEGQPAPAGPMTDERALVLLVAGRYRELRDAVFRPFYLPFPESAAARAEAERRMQAEKSGPAGVLARLMPSFDAAIQAEVRLDRRVAALRVVEAIRMHAAANGGKLPATLDAVTVVPVPLDPVTGKPFEYRVEGDTAVLIGSGPRIPPPWIYHRITIRK